MCCGPALSRYAGDYGERKFILKDGILIYLRDGRPQRRLTAMSSDAFLVEGTSTFRIRFVAGKGGAIVKVEGHYIDGRIDESHRTK